MSRNELFEQNEQVVRDERQAIGVRTVSGCVVCMSCVANRRYTLSRVPSGIICHADVSYLCIVNT